MSRRSVMNERKHEAQREKERNTPAAKYNLRILSEANGPIVGRLIHEYETSRTIGGKPLPDASKMEQSDWYEKVGEMIVEELLRSWL